jgi:hypothetical protein
MNNVWSMCLVATEPGQSGHLAVAIQTDADILAGRSHLWDFGAYLEVMAVYGGLWLLLTHPRSPLRIVARPERPARVAGALGEDGAS